MGWGKGSENDRSGGDVSRLCSHRDRGGLLFLGPATRVCNGSTWAWEHSPLAE